MEVKINKDVREYTESMFFGLSLRQFIFSVIAMVVAVIIYFWLKSYFGTETVSWMCVLGAAPFAALGFITYQSMNAEEIMISFMRSFLLSRQKLISKPYNLYYEIFKDTFEKYKKEALIKDAKKSSKTEKFE